MTYVDGDVLEGLDTRGALVSPPPSSEAVEGLDGVLEALGHEERQVLRLRYVEDLEYGAIAARMGSTPGAVRVRAHRARKRLEALLRA